MSNDRTAGPVTSRPLTAVGIALLVGVGYYVASNFGLLLRVPPATPSIVWPPNAVLTAALLLLPTRAWWLVFLSVLPVHLAAQLPTGWPLMLVLALYLTNSLEALLVAGAVRRFSDAPARFDTPRRLLIFCAAVLFGTVLSGIFDAGAVSWWNGESFWDNWRQRSFSNVLAQFMVVPAVTGIVQALSRWSGRIAWARVAEAAIVWAGLVMLGSSDLGGLLLELPPLRTVSSQAPLALQLPFLLWAAVRFGTAGTGVALFTTTIVAVWSVVNGLGPFADVSPTTTVPALTLSLLVVTATVLAIAALVEERRQTQRVLAERLDFEELLARLSGAFVQVPSDRMDAGFDEWLGQIGRFLRIKCVRLYTPDGTGAIVARYEWHEPATKWLPPPVATRDFPWAFARLQRAQSVAVCSMSDLPADAVADRQSMERYGYRATLALPLATGDRAIGALAFGSAEERAWPDELVIRLRLVAEVLANALARKQTEDALRASETMKSSILHSLRSGVVVVDRDGRVLAMNDNWAVLARQSGDSLLQVGESLFGASGAGSSQDPAHWADVAAGVRAVLRGDQESFHFEYTTHAGVKSGSDARWWAVVVVPLERPEGGAVVTRADVTDLRRAELDVQRVRQEMAHVGRVSTVGELTASLAHELYQPLTAIMTNAQAARRLLSASPPDLRQIHAILSDIVNDDRRASDVIERLRDLLRKGEIEMVPVDLPSTIREVAHLLRGEAIVKRVTVSLDLDGFPVVVLADRVQLQQVMLNLLHNAMEAMSDGRHQPTTVLVRCRRNGETAHVSVSDTGPGLVAGAEETVFEPFYTTKKDGMGMGLSIVRSILESHGGSITAANLERGGAVFSFSLPLAGADVSIPAESVG